MRLELQISDEAPSTSAKPSPYNVSQAKAIIKGKLGALPVRDIQKRSVDYYGHSGYLANCQSPQKGANGASAGHWLDDAPIIPIKTSYDNSPSHCTSLERAISLTRVRADPSICDASRVKFITEVSGDLWCSGEIWNGSPCTKRTRAYYRKQPEGEAKLSLNACVIQRELAPSCSDGDADYWLGYESGAILDSELKTIISSAPPTIGGGPVNNPSVWVAPRVSKETQSPAYPYYFNWDQNTSGYQIGRSDATAIGQALDAQCDDQIRKKAIFDRVANCRSPKVLEPRPFLSSVTGVWANVQDCVDPPTTQPTTQPTTRATTRVPTTQATTRATTQPTTMATTQAPTTQTTTYPPSTQGTTEAPTTEAPTTQATTWWANTTEPTTEATTSTPSTQPTTDTPSTQTTSWWATLTGQTSTDTPSTQGTTEVPTTQAPTTEAPTTQPTSWWSTTTEPTTEATTSTPSTLATTEMPTTQQPDTPSTMEWVNDTNLTTEQMTTQIPSQTTPQTPVTSTVRVIDGASTSSGSTAIQNVTNIATTSTVMQATGAVVGGMVNTITGLTVPTVIVGAGTLTALGLAYYHRKKLMEWGHQAKNYFFPKRLNNQIQFTSIRPRTDSLA